MILAYLDPGSGSALVGTLIAVAGAAVYSLKSFFYRLVSEKGGDEHSRISTADLNSIAIFSEGKNYWSTWRLIVEELTGRRLDEACRELVFDPLGMSETRWGPLKDDGTVVQQPPEFVNTPNAVGEINDERAARCGFPVGNAGVFTTVGDLLKFTGDLARRERFPREYYDLLQRPAFRWEGKVRSFGFDMSPDPALTAASPRAVRHSGYTGQTILADPETGVSAVVLTSRNCPHKDGLRNRNLLINRLVGGVRDRRPASGINQ